MKTKVRLSLLIICSLLCTACTSQTVAVESEPTPPPMQDTLEMVPDFSYAVNAQIPNVFVDRTGYRPEDKKVVFFLGNDLEESFEVIDISTNETVYTGKLFKTKDLDGKSLYAGDFTAFADVGKYYIRHTQVGDSYEFALDESVYEKEFLVLQRSAKEYNYTNVSDAAYVLANMLFIQEMYEQIHVDYMFVEETLVMLLNSQDTKSGAFYSEVFEEPVNISQTTVPAEEMDGEPAGTVSLTTTAQMAGLLAQYSYLSKDTNPLLSSQCLKASQKAYKYMEQYRGNTDTDAWYFAAVQLFRATGQYKYRNAIAEYDIMDPGLKSNSKQGYTILADFTYLSTTYGTDYARCSALLDAYMDKAQSISVNSSRENFYVLPEIGTMSDAEILDDMIILGVVNHILSGQEYAGIQRNYIHYLSGVNLETANYLNERMMVSDYGDVDITNIAKLMVVFGNME